MSASPKRVLWWGRFDPDYSRNRVVRKLLVELGWEITDFHPLLSSLADLEAIFRLIPRTDLVWVPCFRQRDLAAARRWSRHHGTPLLADPLISSWDKQVFERAKFPANSPQANALKAWESRLLQNADIVLADTSAHADFFAQELGVAHDKLHVVYVGAEQPLFSPQPPIKNNGALEVLFYGSFINLQEPQVIIEAARLCHGTPVHWRLIGNGPLRVDCEKRAQGLNNVIFENWLPYQQLPERIAQADILLGIFGNSAKAGRVIPNKVFQAMACSRVVVTRDATAYPKSLSPEGGLVLVEAGNAQALADAVTTLAADREKLPALDQQARAAFDANFSEAAIKSQLEAALRGIKANMP